MRFQRTRARGGAATMAMLLRIAAGLVFVVFGLGKFVQHAHEVDSFHEYGLPAPEVFVYAVGALELVGGAMLIFGLATRLVALLLAGNMIGAIVSAGPVEGGPINYGLAPALLVCMIYLLWAGPGPRSIDQRMVDQRSGS